METRHIGCATAAALLGVHDSTIRRRIENGKLNALTISTERGGANGTAYSIPLQDVLESASLEVRLLWYEAQSSITATTTAADLATYRAAFGDDGLRALAERQQACITLDGILTSGGRGRTAAIEELAGTLGVTSRTLRRWHAAYKAGGLAAIMDKVDRKDKGKPKTICPLAQDWIEAKMCDNRKFPQNLILERLRQTADELGDGACDCCPYCEWSSARAALKPEQLAEYPPCGQAEGRMVIPTNRHAVSRFVETLSDQQLTFARNGKRAWEAAYMQKTTRQKPTRVNECWFGDHHKLDLFVEDENGRVVRPWMTAWMDAYSGVFVGWELSIEPNSDTVADSFARAAVYTVGSDVVGLPTTIYIDNGKDYRSTRFEGERFVESDLGRLNADFCEKAGMLQTLGVGVIHAKPYRGWSKNVERAFGTLERWIREFPGWCGDSPEQRPEDNSRIIKRLQARGELMTFETFAKQFIESVLPQYHAFRGEDGVSPMELYQQGERARSDVPDWATMAMLKSMKAARVISTQGVRLESQLYWHPDMADFIRKQVTILYNRGYNPSVTVMHNGRFVCEAEPVETMAMLETDAERIAAHMADQKRQQKRITDRLMKLRQSTKRVSREMYAEAIDEQRSRMATVVSMEARRAESSKRRVAERAARHGKAASAGANAVREMMEANGKALMERGAR